MRTRMEERDLVGTVAVVGQAEIELGIAVGELGVVERDVDRREARHGE
jgi:hypothetical protein